MIQLIQKTRFLLFLLFNLIVGCSQSQKNEIRVINLDSTKGLDTAICLKFNLKKGSLAVFSYSNKFGIGKQEIFSGINKDTIITKFISTSEPIQYNYIKDKTIPAIFFPGDTVTISISADSVKYNSKNKSSFFINFFWMLDKQGTSIFNYYRLKVSGQSLQNRLTYLEKLKDKSLELLEKNKQTLGSEEYFLIESMINYEYYKHKLIHYVVDKKSEVDQLQDSIKRIIAHENRLYIKEFLTLVSAYNQSLWCLEIKSGSDAAKMYDSCEATYSGKLRDRILIDWLFNIKILAPDRIQDYAKKYLSSVEDSAFYFFVKENFLLTPVLTKKELSNYAGEGESWRSLIDLYKGKVIYIDFWASWCAPCRAEMPNAKKVQNIYKGKDFVYIYISIDDLISNWKSASVEEGIDKLKNNFILLNFEQSYINKIFSIKTIPRYILIDKAGKTIDSNAPRPIELLEKKIIESLIKK